MAAPAFTAADVGCYCIDEAGDVWRLVGFSEKPTATLERVTPVPSPSFLPRRPDRVGGVVGAPIFDRFRRLVPEP